MNEKDSEKYIKECIIQYRNGTPLISDIEFDNLKFKYATLYPNNETFTENNIESDLEVFEGKTIKTPTKMLSIQKAYSVKDIVKWANDIIKLTLDKNTQFRITPKLDGYAAYDTGEFCCTRGDGENGTDITRIFDRGVKTYTTTGIKNIRGMGKGEIVINKHYFNEHLATTFDNSRNLLSSVIKEKELDDNIKIAINDGAVVFFPFSQCQALSLTLEHFNTDDKIESVWNQLLNDFHYETDGLVFEITDDNIKSLMGNTNHHYRWQIAFKKNEEYHDVEVLDVIPQTSKMGRLIPVVLLKPTKISNVIISRATGHHYGNIIDNGIGKGAIVRVCRSGLVIPYIQSVVKKLSTVEIPKNCPSCNSIVKMNGDNLYCENTNCFSQISNLLEYFFKTIGNIDGFGSSVILTLVENEITDIVSIYNMSRQDFSNCGYTGKIGDNLLSALNKSKQLPITDWKFLAAFSIPGVGKGGCEKLLKVYSLHEIFNLSYNDIISIDGFGSISTETLLNQLNIIKNDFDILYPQFNIIHTKNTPNTHHDCVFATKTLVFTGTMKSDKRANLEILLKSFGGKVGSAISKNTDYLVVGENAGSKLKEAEKLGVKILTEDEFLKMLL